MKEAENKVSSKDIGLDITLMMVKFFSGLDDLHYGYWEKGQEITFQNMIASQEAYSEFIISNIPEGVKTILDVGSGSGSLARKMTDKGFKVDCVVPSKVMAEAIHQKQGEATHVYLSRYEDVETDKRYDLVLFSESFQYIPPNIALSKSLGFLNQGGRILICDFFKKDTPQLVKLGGGHTWSKFENALNNLPLEKVNEIDITDQTAPTLDLANKFIKEVFTPCSGMVGKYISSNYPALAKGIYFFLGKKLDKVTGKYSDNRYTGDNFRKYKCYKLLIYRDNREGAETA